jgi:acetyltransferase
LAGEDDVYDAALRRAGMLRVDSIEELFDAAETLARARPLRGERIAILTNGGGPGVMAVDALVRGGGRLAALDPGTIAALDAVLPPTWSKDNPVDIIGDAQPERYVKAVEALARAHDFDALLFLHAPTAIAPSATIARTVAPLLAEMTQPVFACWLGGEAVAEARRIFGEAGIPTYSTPEDAVGAVLQMVRYRRNQTALTETPPSLPDEFSVEVGRARAVLEPVLAAGREMLTEPEAKAVLTAYGVPAVETRIAASPEAAAEAAQSIGFPVVLKILSRDISHKSDVGGVALDIADRNQLAGAAAAMLRRVRVRRPDAAIDGFTVQPMLRRPRAHELLVGAKEDSVFGPVVVFGQGGTAVEVIADRAIGLPPLNLALARHLIAETQIARLLAGYRDRPPADLDAVGLVLVKVAQLVADLPDVVELDINPLIADEAGVVALDARVRLRPATGKGLDRLAIRPYPRGLEEDFDLGGARLTLRPIRPEDEPAHRAFFERLKPEDIRFRFFGALRDLPHSELARYTQIDYDREMAFIATARAPAPAETFGVVRTVADPDNLRAEFAIIVRSDIKGRGLGHALLSKMIRYCQARGTAEIVGEVLGENLAMLDLAQACGFRRVSSAERGVVKLSLPLA